MQTANSKYVICILTAGLILAVFAGADTNIVRAVTGTARQTVTITVPPIRALYVDGQEAIVAVFNNTPVIAAEKLQVFKSGAEIPLSDEIKRRYEKLLPRVDWNRIGWIYHPMDSQTQLSEEATQQEKQLGELNTSLEKIIYSEVVGAAAVSPELIFEVQQELNTSPQSPLMGNCIIRATVYDVEEGLVGISIGYPL